MKLKGIVQGQTIQLLETIPNLDGVEVIIELPDKLLAKQSEKWEDLLTVLGVWKNDSEIDKIFSAIDQERHADLGKDINIDII